MQELQQWDACHGSIISAIIVIILKLKCVRFQHWRLLVIYKIIILRAWWNYLWRTVDSCSHDGGYVVYLCLLIVCVAFWSPDWAPLPTSLPPMCLPSSRDMTAGKTSTFNFAKDLPLDRVVHNLEVRPKSKGPKSYTLLIRSVEVCLFYCLLLDLLSLINWWSEKSSNFYILCNIIFVVIIIDNSTQ